MGKEEIDKYKILSKWKKDNKILIKAMFPKATDKEIESGLNILIDKNLKREEMILNNTYQEKQLCSDTLDVSEFYFKGKPACGGNGVLINATKFNPALKMLESFGDRRKAFKKRMKDFSEDSFEFADYDLKQGNEKVKMNAWYGINGSPTCVFFNLECATAITAKGKNLTSLANCSFEAFLGNNVLFLDMNDVLIFIKNVLSEKKNRKFSDSDILDRNISKRRVLQRIRRTVAKECDDYDEVIVDNILSNCSNEDLNRIYYKNNIEGFFKNTKIRNLYKKAINETDIYVNPDEDKTPQYLKDYLEELWSYTEEYVLYRHEYVDRVYRTKYKKRKRVLVIDTDSNMVYLNPWINFTTKNILEEKDLDRNYEDLRHVIIYTMCYLLSKMIRTMLSMYLKHCNVEESRIGILDMKNEYLFRRMLITDRKKNYASIMEYKEGKDMHNKMDVKGLAIHKSSTNRNASEIFKKILEEKILMANGVPNVMDIYLEVEKFEGEIRRSLLAGESTYLKPASVKDANAYKDPLTNSGYRGALIWNAIYKDKEIIFPDDFFLIKCTLTKEKELDKLEDENIREILREEIFHCPEKRISSKGVYIFAVPRDEEVPMWIKKFIDTDQIVEDTMKAFLPIMSALGTEPIYTGANDDFISNYIEL